MAQNDKKDSTEGIIELFDIVEQPEQKAPPAQHIDFDSQLSDLLGKGKAVTLNDSPELEELLSGLGDESTSDKPRSPSSGARSGISLGEPVGDLADSLFEQSTASESTHAVDPLDDVNTLINQLDMPPSETSAKTAPSEEPKPEVEDLDSLLDSLFSSPAASQIGAMDQEKPAAKAPADTPTAPVSKRPAPGTPLVNADELDTLLAAPDEPASPPRTKTVPQPSLDDDLPDLDSLLDDIVPDTAPATRQKTNAPETARPEPDLDDLLDFSDLNVQPEPVKKPKRAKKPPANEQDDLNGFPDLDVMAAPSAQDAPKDVRQKDAADITAILDEAMPVFEESPFRVSDDEESSDLDDLLNEVELSELDDLLSEPDKGKMEQVLAVAEEPSATQAVTPAAALVTPELLSALDDRLAHLESGLHSLNQRLATLEEQLAASSKDETPEPAAPTYKVEDLFTEGNPLCKQFKSLVRALVTAELPEPVIEVEKPDPYAGIIAELTERLAVVEARPEPVIEVEKPDPYADVIAELTERLAVVEARPEPVIEVEKPDLYADVIAELTERLAVVEARPEPVEAETADPYASVIVELTERLTALEAHPEPAEETERPDFYTSLLIEITERLTALEARPEPEQLRIIDIPDSASIAEDVLALVRVDLEKSVPGSSPQPESPLFATLEKRLAKIEERPLPQLILPELPDAEDIKNEVMTLVHSDMDRIAAESAARVLREEITNLLNR